MPWICLVVPQIKCRLKTFSEKCAEHNPSAFIVSFFVLAGALVLINLSTGAFSLTHQKMWEAQLSVGSRV